MERRNFIRAGAAGAIALAGSQAAVARNAVPVAEKEIIEWRTYEMAFGGNQGLLKKYLGEVLRPALLRKKVSGFTMFGDYGQGNPGKLHVMIAYPDAATYFDTQDLQSDMTYTDAAAEYDSVDAAKPVYTRFSSWLMNAFDGMPRSAAVDPEAGLFELRIYEGYSEDAVRRKISMFNDHEIDIFKETDLDAVFYGEMIAGPYRPALVYLLQFADLAERDANWSKFGPHPEWQRIKDLPEFANSVSNIRREFLVPA